MKISIISGECYDSLFSSVTIDDFIDTLDKFYNNDTVYAVLDRYVDSCEHIYVKSYNQPLSIITKNKILTKIRDLVKLLSEYSELRNFIDLSEYIIKEKNICNIIKWIFLISKDNKKDLEIFENILKYLFISLIRYFQIKNKPIIRGLKQAQNKNMLNDYSKIIPDYEFRISLDRVIGEVSKAHKTALEKNKYVNNKNITLDFILSSMILKSTLQSPPAYATFEIKDSKKLLKSNFYIYEKNKNIPSVLKFLYSNDKYRKTNTLIMY